MSDTQPPAITTPGSLTAEATGPGGAAANYAVSVTDNLDPQPTVACTPASGSLFPLGSTPVNCVATDASGNQATASFPVVVVDTTPPVLTVPGNLTVPATSVAGAVVSFAATATDLVSGSLVPACVPPSGSLFPVGSTTVTCVATDAAGNRAAPGRFAVVVTPLPEYSVCLLYDPSKIKRTGSTIPVKLQVCDANRANLSRPDLAVTATNVSMVSSSTVGVLDDSGQANPDMNFRYDASLAGYIFNLQTTGLAAGSWNLVFRIAGDPTDHTAPFQLR